MNFLDLAQKNAAAGTGGNPAGTPSAQAADQDVTATGAGLFDISAQDLERQQAALKAAQAAQESARAATQATQAAKPAQPSVTTTSAGDRPKGGSQVDKTVVDGIYALTFHGEFDETNVDKEFERIEKFFGELPHRLAVFDFQDVQYINSKTMGYIADWYQRFTDAGGEIVIAHGGAVLDSLDACGITQLVQVLPSAAEALKALREKFPEHVREGVSSVHAEAPARAAAPASVPHVVPSAAELLAAVPAPVAKVEIAPSGAPAPAVAQVKVEQQPPVVSPSGIRDSDGKTFVFYEKQAAATRAAQPEAVPVIAPAPVLELASIKPDFGELAAGLQEEGVTLANAHEIVAAAQVQEEDAEEDLMAAAREFGGFVNAAQAAAAPAVVSAASPAPVVAPAARAQEATVPAPAKVPAAAAARKPQIAAPRARKGRKLILALAVAAAAGAAAFQFAGPAGVSDLLSSVTSYFGAAPAQEASAPAAPVAPAKPFLRPRLPRRALPAPAKPAVPTTSDAARLPPNAK